MLTDHCPLKTECYSVYLFALCLMSLIPLVQAENRTEIEPFNVVYRVDREGITVGEAVLQLEYEDKDHYRMRSNLRLTGLASLLFADSVEEEVEGEVIDGMPRPLTYRSQRNGKKARTVSLRFDWARGDVVATKNGKEIIPALQPRTVDPLTLHLLTMLDLQTGTNVEEYSVISSDRLKTYRTRSLGNARMTTPLGELETQMVSQQRPGSNKITTFWHASELGYLPVQISKTEDGAEVARLMIQQLTR